MGPEMLEEKRVSCWREIGKGREGDVHFRVLGRVHYCCYGNAEVGGRAPEVCGIAVSSVNVLLRKLPTVHIVHICTGQCRLLYTVRQGVVGHTSRAEVIGNGVGANARIERLDRGRHDVQPVFVIVSDRRLIELDRR